MKFVKLIFYSLILITILVSCSDSSKTQSLSERVYEVQRVEAILFCEDRGIVDGNEFEECMNAQGY